MIWCGYAAQLCIVYCMGRGVRIIQAHLEQGNPLMIPQQRPTGGAHFTWMLLLGVLRSRALPLLLCLACRSTLHQAGRAGKAPQASWWDKHVGGTSMCR